MQHTAQAQLALQLQTVIRAHMQRYHVGAAGLAQRLDVTEWAVSSMLARPVWQLDLCVKVLDVLNINLTVVETDLD